MIDTSKPFSVEPCLSGFLVKQDCFDDDGNETDEYDVYAFTDSDDVLRFLAESFGYDANCWPSEKQ